MPGQLLDTAPPRDFAKTTQVFVFGAQVQPPRGEGI